MILGHRCQLDIGALQNLLHPIDFRGSFLDQAGPIAGQLPQLALRLIRDETRLEEPMAQQIRGPLAIPHVGLAARNLFDVLRIHHQHCQVGLLEQVI